MGAAAKTDKSRTVLLELLRRGSATVDDLAEETALTPNAVRFHLASLEEEGQVEPAGLRRHDGAGKPAVLYALTVEAEVGFSKAYAPVLAATVRELQESVPADQVVPFLRRVGKRLAADSKPANRSLANRVAAGASLLDQLGGSTTVSKKNNLYTIRGQGCPLGAVVSREPCMCEAVESLLSNVVGSPVKQKCHHGDRPICCFEISAE